MSATTSTSQLLSDLNRDISRAQPSDPLQWCANWCAARLESERLSSRGEQDQAMRDTTPPQSTKRLSSQPPVGPTSPDRNKSAGGVVGAGGYSFGGPSRNLDTEAPSRRGVGNTASQPPSPFTRVGPRSGGPDDGNVGGSARQTTHPAPLTFGGSGATSGAARSALAARSSAPAPFNPGKARGGDPDDEDSDEEVEDPRDDPNFHPNKSGNGMFGGPGVAGSNAGKLGIPQFNMARRTSVSAESLDPNANVSNLPKTVIPKTESQLQRIEASIANNLLFRNLDEDQHKDVLNAMKEVTVQKGTEVIVQGAVGDFFYVVEQGSFEAWVRAPPTHHYSGPGQSTSVPGEEKKVATYGPGGSFGELALMYNAPRAATVVATSRATMWALDRVTFRSILMEHTSRKRKMYEAFLSEVPILASLNAKERAKIADALEEKIYDEGENVVVEGEVGKNFYIIESGKAEVLRRRKSSSGGFEEDVLGSLGKGDYFGGESQDLDSMRDMGRWSDANSMPGTELALLNSAPRAATVRAMAGQGRLRVATLGEKVSRGKVAGIRCRSAW